MKSLDHRRYRGHYPGHWRDAFLEALEFYGDWKPGQPEPSVEMELGYKTVQVPISRVFGKLCACSGTLPGDAFQSLQDYGIEPKKQTYGAVARALLRTIF